MAAAKTSGNTTANPIEDATKKLAELNEEATQKVTALAENAKKLPAIERRPRSWRRSPSTRPSS